MDAVQALKMFVQTVADTGGLVRGSNGLHAPVADLEWIDLGEAAVAANETLKALGMEVQMPIDGCEDEL